MDVAPKLRTEHLIWLIGSICHFHRKVFDPSLLLQQCPPIAVDYSIEELFQTLSSFGYRYGSCNVGQVESFSELTLPCIAFLDMGTNAPP